MSLDVYIYTKIYDEVFDDIEVPPINSLLFV